MSTELFSRWLDVILQVQEQKQWILQSRRGLLSTKTLNNDMIVITEAIKKYLDSVGNDHVSLAVQGGVRWVPVRLGIEVRSSRR